MELEQKLSLLSVLGGPLRHLRYAEKCPVQFTAGDGSGMRVLVDVTDATRPILSVTKGADTGCDDNIQASRRRKIIRDDATVHKNK